MAFTIRANNKDYIVSPHAAERMVQRGIPEKMVTEALENGAVTEQPHGTDLYEHQIYDEIYDAIVIVPVVVNEETRTIVTVIDNTEGG